MTTGDTVQRSALAPETLAITAILVAATILRLIHLNAGLWYDEILTLTRSVRLSPAELAVTYGSLNNHVLYTWLAKSCAFLFGEAPWSLRLPAAFFGVASIWAVWRLFRETGARGAIVVAAALLAVSYHHVWFSQNARGYTGLLFFTALSAYSLHKALTTGRSSHWFAYAASFAAAMMIHFSAAFLLLAHGLTVLVHLAVTMKRWNAAELWRRLQGPVIGFGVGSAIVVLLFLPMLSGMTAEFADVRGDAGATPAVQIREWKSPLWMLVETIRSFGPIGIAIPPAIILAGIGAWRMTKRAPWIAIPYLIHIPLTLVLLTALSFRVWPRYFFIDIGFLVASLSLGAFWLADYAVKLVVRMNISFPDARTLKAAGSGLMIAASVPLLLDNYKHPKQDFDGAYAFVAANKSADDKTATVGLAEVAFNGYLDPTWASAATIRDLKSLQAGPGRLWIVTAFPVHLHTFYPDIEKYLNAEFELVRRLPGTLSGGDVFVYRSKLT